MRGPNKRRLSCCLKHIQLSSLIVIVIATETSRQWDSQSCDGPQPYPKAEPEPIPEPIQVPLLWALF